MQSESPTSHTESTVHLGDRAFTLQEALGKARSSGSWFFWIAGLSIVNSLAAMMGLDYGMLLGLGVTQMFDGFAIALIEEGASTLVVRSISTALTLCVCGFFIGVGVFARKAVAWAFAIGMVAYAVDALLFVLVGDWIGIGFHAFVLFMLWGGLGMSRAIGSAETPLRRAA